MIGVPDPPDPERSRTVQPLPHYLRTFQHLAPTKERAVRPRRGRGRTWAGVAVLGLLAITLVRRPASDMASTPDAAKRAPATHIALAPSPPPAPVEAPPVRVFERQGPTLIEKLLAEKLGTPAPQATPPREPEQQVAAAPKPAPLPPPPAPKVDEQPAAVAKPAEVEKPAVVASAPRASAPPRLTAPLTHGTRPTPEVTAPLPAPPAAKPTAKPEKPEVARKAEPPAKPQVAKKPEPPTKPQVAAKPEPQPAREIATAPAPKPETLQVATKPQPSAPAPVPVQERPIQVQERAVAVERVEVARPVERPVERLVVEPVPAQAVAVASVPVAEAPAPEPPSADVERVAAVRTATAPPRGAGPSQDAVRGLLDRYAAAWRGHDVDTLRAIGQITNDGQASAMRAYFANVGDLEVEVRVLDIRSDGDRATVRFTRRDRFRDPAGREIAKESPPIEKHVVTTPQGVRFGPSS